MIYSFLILSLFGNIFLCWFLFRFLQRHSFLVSLIEDIQFKIDYFSKHLEGLYELEMFYGEPTIQNLIEHSKLLLSSFKTFNEDYNVFNGKEEYGELQEKAEDER